MNNIVEVASIEQYCACSGQRCFHPGIGIIASQTSPNGLVFKGNIYAIYFRQAWCGNKHYGCGCHDFTSATVVFKAPGEIVEPAPVGQLPEVPVAGILFTPELLWQASFDGKQDEYTFFGYRENESLHLSLRELRTIADNLTTLVTELSEKSDNYTSQLLCKHLGVLLDHCLRYYRRQFILRGDLHERIVVHARGLAEKYFTSECSGKSERQATEYLRSKLPFSSPYLDDLFLTETGMPLGEYIRKIRFELTTKEVGCSDKPFSEIASEMGFPNLQTLSYVFQKLTGYSLREYRRANTNWS